MWGFGKKEDQNGVIMPSAESNAVQMPNYDGHDSAIVGSHHVSTSGITTAGSGPGARNLLKRVDARVWTENNGKIKGVKEPGQPIYH